MVSQMKKHSRRVTCLTLAELEGHHNHDHQDHQSLQRFISDFLETRKVGLEGILYVVEGGGGGGGVVERRPPDVSVDVRRSLEPLLCISKYLLQARLKLLPRLIVATRGVWSGGSGGGEAAESTNLDDPSATFAAPLWGFIRNLRIELRGLQTKLVDMDPDDDNEEERRKGLQSLFHELWIADGESEVMYRAGTRLVRRLKHADDPPEQRSSSLLSIPMSSPDHHHAHPRYTIQLPSSKMIGDLKYVPKEIGVGRVGPGQVEVEVRAASLNFKDVLSVMKPSPFFETISTLGLDFSGVVSKVGDGDPNVSSSSRWAVGDPVFGCNWKEGTIASHVLVQDESALARIPDSMTFAEAATLPAVFITAWQCMVSVANLQPGQRLLVHAASGGVGLAAIQLAAILGVKVIGTAGSPKKRNYVRGLPGVEHVFSSRDLSYAQRIKEVTGGSGVNMVLNCLTGPGFKEASLSLVKDGGHFVEISKLDIWAAHEVEELRPGVNYTVVDATELEGRVLAGILQTLEELLRTGQIRPLTYTRYPAAHLPAALTFLQKARQIGKVILEMPLFLPEENRFRDFLFNERSTYLITGGRGAIGFGVAKWMAAEGAKNLVLVGRSPPGEAMSQRISDELEQGFGCKVLSVEADISDYNQVTQLLSQIEGQGLPTLRGIHHCGGVVSDRMIANQDWANFQAVLDPKVKGAWNLHRATTSTTPSALPSLEFFVTYSSAISTMGNTGQSNYAAANCYLDSLHELRTRMGLKSLNVNWGQWITESGGGMGDKVEPIDWLHPFPTCDGLASLAGYLRSQQQQQQQQGSSSPVCLHLKPDSLVKMFPGYSSTLLESFHHGGGKEQVVSSSSPSPESNQQQLSSTSFADLYATLEGKEEKEDRVRELVSSTVCATLGLVASELDESLHFSDMGMDSLMSIEFTNKLEARLGAGAHNHLSLGYIDMDEYGSVEKMRDLLVGILEQE